MKMVFIFVCSLLFCLSARSQGVQTITYDSIMHRMSRQIVAYPEEKIHLHIDKSTYMAGEKIWLRAYLLNSCFHTTSYLSHYVYVELINPFDSIVSRVKIRSVDGGFPGYISLSEDLPEGEYTLRAYTKYMRNMDDDYFYRRHVQIGNPMSALVHSSLEIDSSNKGKLNASVRFSGYSQSELSVTDFDIQGKDREYFDVKQELDNCFSFNFGEKLTKENSTVLVTLQDDSRRTYRKFIKLDSAYDFDVSFYPEGGNLLGGNINRIAFKALKMNGEDEWVRVSVLNTERDTVASAVTSVNGMGLITFFATPNETYTAICVNLQGKQKTIRLPESNVKAISLKLDKVQNRIVVTPVAASEAKCDSVFLVAHVRGVIVYADWWKKSKPIIRFDQRLFPSGVVQFLLLDKHMNPLSERLTFVDNMTDALVSLSLNNSVIKPRKLVTGQVKLTDQSNSPLVGNFSISVVDENLTNVDTAFNIKADLLLRSELKGYIANPAYYFESDNKHAKVGVDLLMMTHGWRRYNIPQIIKGKFELSTIQPERSQQVSGIVKDGLLLNSNAGDHVDVLILGDNSTYNDVTSTDKKGEFKFEGIEFPDGTGFVLQVLKRNGSKHLFLDIKEDSIPTPQAVQYRAKKEPDDRFQKYMYYAEQNLNHDSALMDVIYLEEVEVTGQHLGDDIPFRFTDSESFSENVIKSYAASTFRDFLEQQLRITFELDKPLFRREDVYFVVDEFSCSYQDLQYDLQMNNVERIELIKDHGAASFWGGGANYGATVWIKTKKGMYASVKEQFNLRKIFPLGYQRPIEFYSPKYEKEEQKHHNLSDYRSTVYWNPVIFTDSQGEASFSFYSTDQTTDYLAVIEGICTSGEIIYLVKKLNDNF
ncbi:hypothetical protein [Sunxiuqinia indica]|uniref:hypothetical protein n=1 Tax=Sunxiuqinia indica TaxID=2692584 RepID=UPI00135A0E2C|nr:hypothetical protein [Sunxiuqinia indica]